MSLGSSEAGHGVFKGTKQTNDREKQQGKMFPLSCTCSSLKVVVITVPVLECFEFSRRKRMKQAMSQGCGTESAPLTAAEERDAESNARLWSSEAKALERSSAAASQRSKFKLSVHGTNISICLLVLPGNPPCKLALTGAVAC